MTERAMNKRDNALDFTKGALVLFMILYHWINYFVTFEGFFWRYLRFITPSFIFITGFLITHVYLAKYDIIDGKLRNRLIERGAKLLVLFILLNLMANIAFSRNYNGAVLGVRSFWDNAVSIFLVGNGQGAIFDVLVPISYLLLISAGLLITGRYFVTLIYFICAGVIAFAFVLNVFGLSSGIVELLSIGFMGMLIGRIPLSGIRELPHLYTSVIVAFVAYIISITVWDVFYLILAIGVFLSLFILYLIGQVFPLKGFLAARVFLLGQYTLFAYIIQIAILQIMRRTWPRTESFTVSYLLSFIAAFALTILAVELLDKLTKRSMSVNLLYKYIFA
jgi:peptidoglycan/LPS O-acetylase OafA/YrhL